MSTDQEPALTSPCPHAPGCPPPVCLPPALLPTTAAGTRTTPVRDPGGSGQSGYESAIGYLDSFAGTMTEAAEGVGLVRQRTPRFEGWNLAPLAGMPVVGLMFVNRFNTIADTWSDSAGILRDVLVTDAGKISRSALNYRRAEHR
ncbi:hypothetical protein [Nonomuraea sp. NPDC048826]|uniref:hypothetical protein n=1 Tax=Nonomuraea sp. NPDC048826 TaxID=3364347 RepID=UPI0037100A3C